MDKIIFLSHVLDARTPLYGGKGVLSLEWSRQITKGDSSNAMSWAFGNHTGTHVDAPKHFIKKGRSIDQFKAYRWQFENVSMVTLKKVKPGQMLTQNDMGLIPKNTELLLIKTGFESKRGQNLYWKNSPFFSAELAGWLHTKAPKLRAIGMDVISLSNIHNRDIGRQAHKEFLKREIFIIEDMKLSVLKSTPQKVLVVPLLVKDADASPCTVLAWERS